MTITIRLRTENAAFEDKDAEIGRILRAYVQDALRLGVTRLGNVTLHDVNGNSVGSVTVAGK